MGGGLRLDNERISLEANSLAGAAGYFNAKTLPSLDNVLHASSYRFLLIYCVIVSRRTSGTPRSSAL